MPEFVVYTDGASRKDRRGGWGYSIWYDDVWWDDCGGEYDTTNNRMELMGVIAALEMILTTVDEGERPEVEVWSDSMYVIGGASEHIDMWRYRNWRTSSNKPIKNLDLWKRLDELAQQIDATWKWVKGHTGDEGNERADRLAARGIPQAKAEVRREGIRVQRWAAQWTDTPRAGSRPG